MYFLGGWGEGENFQLEVNWLWVVCKVIKAGRICMPLGDQIQWTDE